MVDREVNLLEQRYLALSARFKAAWAFHQLLMGLQRLQTGDEFESRSDTFQSLYSRLKGFTESLHGAAAGLDARGSAELAGLEREVSELVEELTGREESIGPSELRRFFTQVRALDDRILIEVVRFYLEIQKDAEWPRDRLDKIDFLISRLAERIAGPDLQADRRRLDKVLQGILASAKPVAVPEPELEGLLSTLQDLRSEVRWVKTFEELNESRRVEVYRALKQDMGGRIFHPRLLPLVVEVNNVFRRKIDALRVDEERRLIEDYQRLSQLQERSNPRDELQAELAMLQEQVEQFRDRAKSDDVRIKELVTLGASLRDVASRLQAQVPDSVDEVPASAPVISWSAGAATGGTGLVPDLDCLQPHWSVLMRALAGLGSDISHDEATSETSLAAFRLESREVAAFRRGVGASSADPAPDSFILAAAAMRRRICEDVDELRSLQSQIPGSIPHDLLQRSRDSLRIADAYVKHFSHLVDQAVFDGEMEEASAYQRLQTRLLREYSGLAILIPRGRGSELAKRSVPQRDGIRAADVFVVPPRETAPVEDLSED